MAQGRWQEAEAELLAAIKAFERGYRADAAFPLVRLAELRVRQGRFEEAERLLEDREWDPRARRAVAAIALGRRRLPLAAELATLCLEGAAETIRPAGRPLSFSLAPNSRGAINTAPDQRSTDSRGSPRDLGTQASRRRRRSWPVGWRSRSANTARSAT